MWLACVFHLWERWACVCDPAHTPGSKPNPNTKQRWRATRKKTHLMASALVSTPTPRSAQMARAGMPTMVWPLGTSCLYDVYVCVCFGGCVGFGVSVDIEKQIPNRYPYTPYLSHHRIGPDHHPVAQSDGPQDFGARAEHAVVPHDRVPPLPRRRRLPARAQRHLLLFRFGGWIVLIL